MTKKILVVEDDTDTRDLYKDLLTAEGFEVVTATDGELGLSEAKKGGYHLILLDVMMPKKDGVSFLKEYKTFIIEPPNGQIIVLSNIEDDVVIKTCLSLGAAGFLIKSSLTPDEVLREVKSYLS